MNHVKTCLSCGREMKGRDDKKFCDYRCRNDFNNQHQAERNNYMRNVMYALKKNRRILAEIVDSEDLQKTTRKLMLSKGYQFQYLTHQYTNSKGQEYYFCFEYGYLPLDNDWCLVLRYPFKM